MQQNSDISQTLLRRFWIIILGLILGGALGALVSQQMSPIYRSSVYLLVVPESSNAGASTANDYAQAYSKLVADPAVTGNAVTESEVGVDPWDVRKFVNVEVTPNAPILQITASSTDPEDASTLANALGSGLSSFTEENAEDTGYQAEVIARAIPPANPALPDWILNIVVGAVAGLLLGVVVVLLLDGLRQTWKARADQRRARQEEKDLQRRARQEEKDRQGLEREMAELEKSAERYHALEKDKERLEAGMDELQQVVERYLVLKKDKERLEREMAELEKQRLEAGMDELQQIVERYLALKKDKERLEREMAEFEKSAERYHALEKDKERLEREMAELEKSVERYRALRADYLQKSHR